MLQLVTLPVLIGRHNPDGQAWKAAVPGLHFFAWLDLIERPWYWAIFLLVPGINLIMLTVMHVELGVGLWTPCPQGPMDHGCIAMVGTLGIAPGQEAWIGKRDWSKTRKSTAREWSEALIWATVVAGSLRMLIVEPFTIPTPSMEGSMLVGDYLVVSKTSYGPKLPRTPFTMPFVHNALPGGLTPSYTDWFSLAQPEVAGFRDVERYDAVVFSFPHGDTVYVDPNLVGHDYYAPPAPRRHPSSRRRCPNVCLRPRSLPRRSTCGRMRKPGLRARPVDKMENYVKRCVALPGETVSMVDGQLHIDGVAVENPEGLQKEYRVVFSSQAEAQMAFRKLELTKLDLGPVSAVSRRHRRGHGLTESEARAIETFRPVWSP